MPGPHLIHPSVPAMKEPPGSAARALQIGDALCRLHQGAHVPPEVFGRVRAHARGLVACIIEECPASPERSTAIAKAREALMWAIAALVVQVPPSDPAVFTPPTAPQAKGE